MIQDPVFLTSAATVLTSFAGGFLAALWVALIIWTYRDSRKRIRDKWVHILASAVVAILTLPGVIIYLILRPQKTLDEEYQQTLEEEALLQSIENQNLCPGCERHVQYEWIICPSCQTKLRKRCHQCGNFMDLPWNICPYCATPIPGIRKESKGVEK